MLIDREPLWYIDRRIATEEGGYPLSEARFGSVEDYAEYIESLLRDTSEDGEDW